MRNCHRIARSGVTRWGVWALPARLLSSVLVVEVLAVVLLVTDVVRGAGQLTGHGATVLAPPAWLGVLHTEIALRVERMRRRVTPSPHVDLSSVWTFAAASPLPPLPATLHRHRDLPPPLSPGVATHAEPGVPLALHHCDRRAGRVCGRGGRGPTSTTRTCSTSGSGLAAIVTALLCYTAVNTCLVVGRRSSLSAPSARSASCSATATRSSSNSRRCRWARSPPGWSSSSTSPLHALLGVTTPGAAPCGARAPVGGGRDRRQDRPARRRSVARPRHPCRIDHARESGGSAAVLVVDLDHFKQVNDRHGHSPATGAHGRRVVLREDVRDNDLVGRFGGEEFVIMLPGRRPLRRLELEPSPTGSAGASPTQVEVATPDGALTVGDLERLGRRRVFPTTRRPRRCSPSPIPRSTRPSGRPQRGPDGVACARHAAARTAVGGRRRRLRLARPAAGRRERGTGSATVPRH